MLLEPVDTTAEADNEIPDAASASGRFAARLSVRVGFLSSEVLNHLV